MKQRESYELRYFILSNDKTNLFDFNKGFFELDMFDINRLDKYAEIFKIKSYNGVSRARKLWAQVRSVYLNENNL